MSIIKLQAYQHDGTEESFPTHTRAALFSAAEKLLVLVSVFVFGTESSNLESSIRYAYCCKRTKFQVNGGMNLQKGSRASVTKYYCCRKECDGVRLRNFVFCPAYSRLNPYGSVDGL